MSVIKFREEVIELLDLSTVVGQPTNVETVFVAAVKMSRHG